MANKPVVEADKRLQKEAFKKSLALHDSEKGGILYRYTKDGKLQVSGAPYLDVAFKSFPNQIFGGRFYPGMKMHVKYAGNGNFYTAEFLGQFPSVEAANARMRDLELKSRKADKRNETEGKKTKPERGPITKKAKSSVELTNKTPVFSSFQERLRFGGHLSSAGVEKGLAATATKSPDRYLASQTASTAAAFGSKTQLMKSRSECDSVLQISANKNADGAPVPGPLFAFQRSLDYGRSFISTISDEERQMSPLKPNRVEEDDVFGDESDATYTTLRAPYAKDIEGFTFVASPEDYCINSMTAFDTVGGWNSQNDLISDLAVKISLDERDQMPEGVEEKLVHARAKASPEEVDKIYTESDSVLFQREALLAAPVTFDNQPAKNLTTILFPTKVFGQAGAPNKTSASELSNNFRVKPVTTVVQVLTALDGVPGVVMDTRGPFNYVSDYILPKKYTSDVSLSQKKPPLFKDDVEWHTTDMPRIEEYIIPTKRTQEKEFSLKNPARVNQSAIFMRDSVSKWYFSIGGPDKALLDEDHPGIYVDLNVVELYRKFLNREVSSDKFTWFLMCRLLGGNPGLIRLWTLYDMATEKKDSPRLYNFYENLLGKAYFAAVEAAVNRKIREMIPDGAPGNAAVIPTLPKTQWSFPSFFSRRMNSWMKDCRKRDEASKSNGPREESPRRNIGSDEDE